ncbi:MFS transporter [Niveibacterium sp. SC-1]|uniref:MFS transporter n=1 Tax=Niveibacterium sp. SC-1 TaxID=3135646 RepID=UPI0031200713
MSSVTPTHISPARSGATPFALYALAAAAFVIGTSEFVIMGLLLDVARDLSVSVPSAGLLVTGYALGVVVGAPFLTAAGGYLPRKVLLLVLAAMFVIGNLLCANAPNYGLLMAARVITALAHGTFFGVGAVVAARLVGPERQASAVALMFSGLTLANVLGVPFGTWLGQHHGWRSTFWVVAAIGVFAWLMLAIFLPRGLDEGRHSLGAEVRALRSPQVWLALGSTALGSAGLFGWLTYIAPLLTERAGLPMQYLSPALVLFGVALVIGNIWGGRLADRGLRRALYVSLGLLAASLFAFQPLGVQPVLAVIATFAIGVAGFVIVAPLQTRAMEVAREAPTLASALNIAAFNLGNATGAAVGGWVVAQAGGLAWVPVAAGLMASCGLLTVWLGYRSARARLAACAG